MIDPLGMNFNGFSPNPEYITGFCFLDNTTPLSIFSTKFTSLGFNLPCLTNSCNTALLNCVCCLAPVISSSPLPCGVISALAKTLAALVLPQL